MQAVIRTGGKQYYVTAGDILEVDRMDGNVGDTITLDDILMISTEDEISVGQPVVEDASVTAKITGQYRDKKILVFRYRPKKRIRVRRGHRQYLTRLEIESIKFGDIEYLAPEPVAPVVVEPEPIVEDDFDTEDTFDDTMDEGTVTELESTETRQTTSDEAEANDVASLTEEKPSEEDNATPAVEAQQAVEEEAVKDTTAEAVAEAEPEQDIEESTTTNTVADGDSDADSSSEKKEKE